MLETVKLGWVIIPHLVQPSASLDETAANNVDMYCGDGTNLPGGGMHWGDWTYAVSCPAGTAVCGIKTKGQ